MCHCPGSIPFFRSYAVSPNPRLAFCRRTYALLSSARFGEYAEAWKGRGHPEATPQTLDAKLCFCTGDSLGGCHARATRIGGVIPDLLALARDRWI